MLCPRCGGPVDCERIVDDEWVYQCTSCGWGQDKAVEKRAQFEVLRQESREDGDSPFWAWCKFVLLGLLLALLIGLAYAGLRHLLSGRDLSTLGALGAPGHRALLALGALLLGLAVYLFIGYIADPYEYTPDPEDAWPSVQPEPVESKPFPKLRRLWRINAVLIPSELNSGNFVSVFLMLPGKLFWYWLRLGVRIFRGMARKD